MYLKKLNFKVNFKVASSKFSSLQIGSFQNKTSLLLQAGRLTTMLTVYSMTVRVVMAFWVQFAMNPDPVGSMPVALIPLL